MLPASKDGVLHRRFHTLRILWALADMSGLCFLAGSETHTHGKNTTGMTSTIPLRIRSREGTDICNFGVPSPLDFFMFLQWIFCFFVRKSPQNVKKVARSPGRAKSVESCHVFSLFFGKRRGNHKKTRIMYAH